MALGRFLFNAGRQADAEASLKQAHQLDPKNARRLPGCWRRSTSPSGRAPEAEPYLKSLADAAPTDYGPKLDLADYYVDHGRAWTRPWRS